MIYINAHILYYYKENVKIYGCVIIENSLLILILYITILLINNIYILK